MDRKNPDDSRRADTRTGDLLALAEIPEPLAHILHEAIHENASDVHLDPVGDSKVVRYRVDGILHEKEALVRPDRLRLVNLVKVNSRMSPDRTIAPLEGLMLVAHDDAVYDVRVTIIPILEREAVHLRFVASKHGLLGLDDIGICPAHKEAFSRQLAQGDGLILIAGATGSGKTTTLYALVSSMDLRSQVIASIEDPIEFRIPYLRQVQVDERQGLTMQEGLRTLLRMDPEGIVVGEIRDQASAMIAGRASLAGRIVLATVHAPNAATAVSALQNLSVPRHVLGNALRMVVVQDLVPRLCRHCCQEQHLGKREKEAFEKQSLPAPASLWVAPGCPVCHGYGHAGRIGVFEVVEVDGEMGYALAAGVSHRDLAGLFAAKRGRSLAQDALEKAAAGIISFQSAWQVAESAG